MDLRRFSENPHTYASKKHDFFGYEIELKFCW